MALSFVRRASDLQRVKLYLEQQDSQIPVIAKIEKPEGWKNLEQILDECEGVMVARGDLGVEVALEKVPFIQKRIIERARAKGKFVITATQMLESMIEHSSPTRAEVSDVANAICDGTDAVMLSAETSTGRYPELAARMMARIAEETESWLGPQGSPEPLPPLTPSNAEIIADAAYHAARSAGVAAIVVFTTSGASARLISRFRPPVPIFAFTQNECVARQLSVSLWSGADPGAGYEIHRSDAAPNGADAGSFRPAEAGRQRGFCRRAAHWPDRQHQPDQAAPHRGKQIAERGGVGP